MVLADDLIWATRLAALVRGLGAEAVTVRDAAAFRAALPGAAGVLVDLTARAYDGVEAVAAAAAAGVSPACLAQHDDATLRRRALAAGASRVLPYRLVAERGAAALAGWPGPAADVRPRATPRPMV